MKVVLVDLGVGNLHSLEKALVRALPGAVVEVAEDPAAAIGAPLLVLPGVGAFGAAAARLAPARERLRDALRAGQPAIGICLGMQLLFEGSDEGAGEGLGLCAGRVERLRAPRLPHMGWTPLEPGEGPALPLPAAVYYAHTFACRPADASIVRAWSTVEGDRFPAIVRAERTVGCQFHPEKSSDEGVALLGALAREVMP